MASTYLRLVEGGTRLVLAPDNVEAKRQADIATGAAADALDTLADVNAAGATQIAAVNTAGGAQVTAVQAEGATQVAAVNTAGAAFGTSLVLGRPATVATGTTISSQQAFVFNTPVAGYTVFTAMQAFFNATGTVIVSAASLVGGVFVPRRGSQRTVTVGATGNQTISLSAPLVLNPGEYLVFKNAAASMLKLIVAAGDSGGYYSSTASLVTNTTLNTTNQLQVRFVGSVIATPYATEAAAGDAALTATLASLLGDSLAAPYEQSTGRFGTFASTTTVGATSIYCNNEPQAGKPSGVEIETSSGGTGGKLLQIATSGEVLASVTVNYTVGGNYFNAADLAAMIDHPSWVIGFEPASGGGRQRSGTPVGGPTNISFALASSHNVGDVITFNAPAAATLSIKIYSSKATVLQRITALETTGRLTGTPVPLRVTKPALLLSSGLNHIIGYGQSNDVGEDATPIISAVASVRHKKFGPTIRPTKAGLAGADAGSAFDGTLVALAEDTTPNVSGSLPGETFATSFAKLATRRIGQSAKELPIFLLSVAGKGATDIAGLAGAWLANLKEHIDQGIARAKALGVDYQVLAIPMDHGEADNAAGTTKATYYATAKTMMETVQAYYQAQTAAAGGSVTAKTNYIIWLWSTATKEAANASQKGNASVAEAVLALCDDLAYCEYYSPAYRFPYVNTSHHTAQGQALKGAYLARAVASILQGHSPDRIRWGSATASGTTLRVSLTAPSQVALDGTILGSVTQYGMAVQDDTGAVALSGFSVSTGKVSANGQITCTITATLARALGTNPYFRAGKDYKPTANPLNGGFTSIVDSTTETETLADASTHTLAHFAPPVTLAITAYE